MTLPATVLLAGDGMAENQVGGKGASLDRLIRIGERVPITGVVTTAGYRQLVDGTGLAAFLDELRAAPPPEPDRFDELTRRVDEEFLNASMPATLRDEILALAEKVGEGGELAVRSSATAEDMTSASFAGQYRSFLEVETPEQVLRSVRLVWSSLWLPAPRSYRRFRGIDDSDLAMAVVIMRLVDAKLAGVVFTVDPGGEAGAARLEAVEGLAEKLVSGEVTPEAYVVSRRAPRAGLERAHPVFSEVVDRALLVEERFGGPQDVEWAYDGEELYLVQARPITTTPSDIGDDDGFDTATTAALTYTTAGIAEMMPGMLPPLLWTTIGTYLEEAFRRLFDGLAQLPDEIVGPYGMVGRFRGRAALNLDLLRDIAADLPGGSTDELERQYFGQVISHTDTDATETARSGFARGLSSVFQGAKEIRARNAFAREAEIAIESVDVVIESRVDPAGLADDGLIAYRHRLLDLAGRVVAAEVAVAAAAAAAYRGIELFLEGRVPPAEVGLWAQRLTTGGIHTCGGQMAFSVCDVVNGALADEALSAILTDGASPSEMRTRLAATDEGLRLVDRLDDLLHLAGSAAIFAGPTWAEQEGLVWQVLRHAIDHGHIICPDCGSNAAECECGNNCPATLRTSADRVGALAQLERQLTKTWKWRSTRIFTGQLVDIRKRMLRRMVTDAFEFLDRRERAKTAMLRLGGEVRRVHAEMAGCLSEKGALQSPEDISYLSAFEVDAAFAGSGPSYETISRRRRQHDQAKSAGPLPRLFQGRPPVAEPEKITGDSFGGWAGSPGRFRGRAVVIHDPTEPLERGQIMVARTTDPSWTPLFLTAGAILVEEGGPLSHAAIVARELGLPAVLNIPGIVDRLDGRNQIVTVDGTTGTVTVHRDQDAIGEEAA